MTDGLTEGQDEPTAPDEDKTTALIVPPAATPHPTAAESDEPLAGPRVLLLGSGEFGRELAVALQGLGAQVIAVDAHGDAPHRAADQALVARLTNAEELTALFGRLQPDFPDFVVVLTNAVSVEALDALDPAEVVPSARSVRLIGDREALRKLAADELGLPTAPFWFVGSRGELEAVAAHAGYPLLVKPVVGGRQRAVVRGPDEIPRAWQRAAGRDPAGSPPRVLAEAVVDIEFLVTLIAVHSEGPAGPVIEFCAPIGHRRADGKNLESWQPQQLTTAALDAAKSIAARIVKALGGRGVFGVELMVNGDEVYFADVTAWPGDSAWVTLRSQRLSAFELQARTILGLAVDTLMVSPGAAQVIGSGQIPPSADALTAALEVPESDVRVFGHARAVALATAPDVATARARARDVAHRLNMRDSRG
ncbi:formate-dependent phosphoribosylglycinamide formyltransferase [Mycobacterium simiae]|uniref:Formate-dependent phosphoribosylglycinamide formyltransferase n=1 Tax=Mycobacterium simiae TaxID=1784 RepID=A0A5B1BLA7_MYCSI|nr:formate-dependent phosphoribosylglycinamide formyltransferase [Mycobacterium simiae]KAA1249477.1 formate-dependent phosphoribosylglycinamide formyltransferase [Mycobacterium simiae]